MHVCYGIDGIIVIWITIVVFMGTSWQNKIMEQDPKTRDSSCDDVLPDSLISYYSHTAIIYTVDLP